MPTAIDQIQTAVPTSSERELREEARTAEGLKQEILLEIQERLEELPSADEIAERAFDPALEITVTAFEILVGIVFTLAAAAY